MKPVQTARAPWSDVIVVCGKCARKAKAKTFAKEVKRACKQLTPPRRVRVIESGCLDLCPKKRIALATADQLARRRLTVAAPDHADAAIKALLQDRTAEPPMKAEKSLLYPVR